MDAALLEMFRFHAWATKHLLAFCRALPDEALGASATGAYGTILDTASHLVRADGGYLRSLGGTPPPRPRTRVDLVGLERQADRLAEAWEALLAGEVDPDRKLVLDKGTYEVGAAVVIAQVIHHGDLHREQICAILTAHGTEPPDDLLPHSSPSSPRFRKSELQLLLFAHKV